MGFTWSFILIDKILELINCWFLQLNNELFSKPGALVLFLEGSLSLRKLAVPLKAHTDTLHDTSVLAFIPALLKCISFQLHFHQFAVPVRLKWISCCSHSSVV